MTQPPPDRAPEEQVSEALLFTGIGLAKPPRLLAHWTSKDGTWRTPRSLFARLDREFGGFTLDACAEPGAGLCPAFYSSDSLVRPWTGRVWCNPPYGRDIGAWIQKGAKAAAEGALVVMLLPSRTDTAWWHEVVMREATDIRFIRGRLRFSGCKTGAPFPSALVVFGSAK